MPGGMRGGSSSASAGGRARSGGAGRSPSGAAGAQRSGAAGAGRGGVSRPSSSGGPAPSGEGRARPSTSNGPRAAPGRGNLPNASRVGLGPVSAPNRVNSQITTINRTPGPRLASGSTLNRPAAATMMPGGYDAPGVRTRGSMGPAAAPGRTNLPNASGVGLGPVATPRNTPQTPNVPVSRDQFGRPNFTTAIGGAPKPSINRSKDQARLPSNSPTAMPGGIGAMAYGSPRVSQTAMDRARTAFNNDAARPVQVAARPKFQDRIYTGPRSPMAGQGIPGFGPANADRYGPEGVDQMNNQFASLGVARPRQSPRQMAGGVIDGPRTQSPRPQQPVRGIGSGIVEGPRAYSPSPRPANRPVMVGTSPYYGGNKGAFFPTGLGEGDKNTASTGGGPAANASPASAPAPIIGAGGEFAGLNRFKMPWWYPQYQTQYMQMPYGGYFG
jgi:hypothetical protein